MNSNAVSCKKLKIENVVKLWIKTDHFMNI